MNFLKIFGVKKEEEQSQVGKENVAASEAKKATAKPAPAKTAEPAPQQQPAPKKAVQFVMESPSPDVDHMAKGPQHNETYYIRQTWDVSRFKSPDQESVICDDNAMFNADGSMILVPDSQPVETLKKSWKEFNDFYLAYTNDIDFY